MCGLFFTSVGFSGQNQNIEQIKPKSLLHLINKDFKADALTCLTTGDTSSNCKEVLLAYSLKVSNPKYYGDPKAFLINSPLLSEEKIRENNELTKEEKITKITLIPKLKDLVEKIDYSYDWKNKNEMLLSTGKNSENKTYYSCDLDPEIGLQTKLQVKEMAQRCTFLEERYLMDRGIKV